MRRGSEGRGSDPVYQVFVKSSNGGDCIGERRQLAISRYLAIRGVEMPDETIYQRSSLHHDSANALPSA